jgi:transposase-like protein
MSLPGSIYSQGSGIVIAVDETKLFVKGVRVYVWSAVNVNSSELLALETSYGWGYLDALASLKKALRMCTNKHLVVVDRGPWYRWSLERFGMRISVERFLRYPQGKTVVFYHKVSVREHIQGIKNLKLFLNDPVN